MTERDDDLPVDRRPPAQVVETAIGDIPWIVAQGERLATFHALGRHAADRIAATLAELPELARLRALKTGSDHLAGVLEASREGHPDAWEELAALASGAGVDAEDLALLSLRGDVGVPGGDECSDLAWSDGQRAVLGHNEDGSHVLDGRCAILTLLIQGVPAVVTWWYPGFLPGNTFTINGSGLAFGVDAIPIPAPPRLPARAFVARGLQHAAGLDEAVTYLSDHPTAGGFAFVLGQLGSPRLITVEHAAGLSHASETGGLPATVWHTNHLRSLPNRLDRPSEGSMRRGDTLAAVSLPAPAGVDAIKQVLTAPPPAGVRASGDGRTLCTLIVDLIARELTMVPSNGGEQTVQIDRLLAG